MAPESALDVEFEDWPALACLHAPPTALPPDASTELPLQDGRV
eukprot:CAMPEP_0185909786 /NCGR_PEP_ID=MMETSP0196C-20130402/15284_1 /TAXON_ID=2932 /ORGANISM="Alexandrium fundyense, Strain CCMP1719" /LENGTH=42 /DNA_ID= /DNA_START= /DNA_END= /DNA_ORIENTATION=